VNADPILRVSSLVAGYDDLTIVRGVDLEVPRGAIVSVIGPNGAGKSTLLKAIYGILRPDRGTVVLRGNGRELDVTGLRPSALTRLGLNYVPQLDNVFPNMSVLENLEIGAILRGRERRAAVEAQLERFPLLRERRRQRAGTLSGGQRKVLALARALLSDPMLLLLDEPSAGLSPQAVEEVLGQLTEINRAGISIVMVEQNARRALALSGYAYVLDMGRNRYEGRGDELLQDEKIAELYLGGASRRAT
jgi:ABC-type branched-subunit amino acid transport system ATPase component